MSNIFLLLDFGASHTKAAMVNLDNGQISPLQTYPSLGNCVTKSGRYEISLAQIKKQFLEICAAAIQQLRQPLNGVLICSQMHGFILLDQSEQPISDYISWRDERSLEVIDGISTFDLVRDALGDRFQVITGMKPRPGLPFMNALHFFRENPHLQNKIYKIITLPEWLALAHEDSCHITHPTIQVGLGFHNIEAVNFPSEELLTCFATHTHTQLVFNPAPDTLEIAGYYHSASKGIPIYAGVGDLQCALLGADITEQVISINIGTGSQVSRLMGPLLPQFERRPFFNKKFLLTQTHIPAGRALNEYVSFLTAVCHEFCSKNIDIWSAFGALSKEDILGATLLFDLNIFESAYRYTTGGKIMGIKEGQFTVKNYLASLLKALLLQYADVALNISGPDIVDDYLFSGGITKKLPVLLDVFFDLTGKNIKSANVQYDETFLGLKILAMHL